MVSIFHSNYKDYRDEHVQAVLRYCRKTGNRVYKLSSYDILIKKYFGPLVIDMQSMLEADAEKLTLIKQFFDNLPDKLKEDICTELNFKGLYNYFLDNKFQRSDGSTYNSAYLARRIIVPVCPYCNENYTYNIIYGRYPTYRRSYDWDHFYNKDFYPFLAVSYFNLVPSCKFCNFIKLNQNLDFLNPHLNLNTDTLFSFHFQAFDLGYLQNEESIKMYILYYKNTPYYKEIKNTVKTAALLTRFANHKIMIKDIINRKRRYPMDYLASQHFVSLGLSNGSKDSQLYETMFNAVPNHEQYFMRPFSKLTKDVLVTLERNEIYNADENLNIGTED